MMDVSGSMYRFNGEDQRLERLLEGALMVGTYVRATATARSDSVRQC